MQQTADFSTVFVNAISPAAAQQFKLQGYSGVQIGFDNSPASGSVLAAILGAGLWWDAYRFLYWNLDVSQVQSCIDGIHQFSPDNAHLPGYCFFDCEENTNGPAAPSNPAAYLHALRLSVENAGITPTSLVKPGIYTRAGWWNQWCAGYDELSSAGWVLWSAEEAADPDHATLYGGWQQSQVVGVQNRWEIPSPIGTVDGSVFRDRGTSPQPPELLLQPVGTFYASDGKTLVTLRAS